ncbi:MAG: hypothetical protein HKN36_06705 [Hellea sp.]|nr:hypothetical protein [Hellea sp.]
MSNSRLVGSAMSITFGLSVAYGSLFYVPAYFNYKQAFGINTVSEVSADKKKSFLSPYIDLLNLDRAFLRAGQGVEAVYEFPAGTNAQLVFFHCQAPALIEILRCNPVIIKTIKIGNQVKGKQGLRVSTSGFYGFDVRLDNPDADYKIVWQRRY